MLIPWVIGNTVARTATVTYPWVAESESKRSSGGLDRDSLGGPGFPSRSATIFETGQIGTGVETADLVQPKQAISPSAYYEDVYRE